MKRRCSLCGGKLVNQICVDCGLDNTKNDDQYTFEKKECEDAPMTHVHTGREDPLEGKTLTKDVRRQAEKRTKQQSGRILTAIALIVTICGTVIPWIGEKIEEYNEPEAEVWSSESSVNFDPYAYVTRALSETGERYSISLSAGLYKCGVHIPEGQYTTQAASDAGALHVSDEENQISLYLEYGLEAEGIDEVYKEDIRLYKGALIEVEDNLILYLETENAQMDLAGMTNPNTERKTLEEQFTAGVDIPAGTYDVYCEEGSGIFEYYIPHNGYDSYEGKLIGDEQSSFPRIYRNIVLPEGVEVTIAGMKVTLTPSETIESEDYLDFYPDI